MHQHITFNHTCQDVSKELQIITTRHVAPQKRGDIVGVVVRPRVPTVTMCSSLHLTFVANQQWINNISVSTNFTRVDMKRSDASELRSTCAVRVMATTSTARMSLFFNILVSSYVQTFSNSLYPKCPLAFSWVIIVS